MEKNIRNGFGNLVGQYYLVTKQTHARTDVRGSRTHVQTRRLSSFCLCPTAPTLVSSRSILLFSTPSALPSLPLQPSRAGPGRRRLRGSASGPAPASEPDCSSQPKRARRPR